MMYPPWSIPLWMRPPWSIPFADAAVYALVGARRLYSAGSCKNDNQLVGPSGDAAALDDPLEDAPDAEAIDGARRLYSAGSSDNDIERGTMA